MAGRVYSAHPRGEERSAIGGGLFTGGGVPIQKWLRVAFDEEADEGLAVVHFLPTNAAGEFIWDIQSGTVAVSTFRAWVKFTHPGEPHPVPVERLDDEPGAERVWHFKKEGTNEIVKIDAHQVEDRKRWAQQGMPAGFPVINGRTTVYYSVSGEKFTD